MRRFPATLELSFVAAPLRDLRRHPARLHGGPPPRPSHRPRVVVVTCSDHDPGVLPRLHPQVRLRHAARLAPLRRVGRPATSRRPTTPNLYVLDGILTGEWDAAWDAFLHLILPASRWPTIPLAIIVAHHPRLGARGAELGLRAHRLAKGTRRGVRSAYHAQRAAAGLDHHRAAGRAAAVRRRAHRDRVRLPRHRSFLATRDLHRDYPVLQGFILFIAVVTP